MANELSKIKLHVKDYLSNDEAETLFSGEVVSLDLDLKTHIYRFFDGEGTSLMISIDYSKEKVIVQERSSSFTLFLELEEGEIGKCVYKFEESTTLELSTKSHLIEILNDRIKLDYDLFNPKDLDHPLTRNIVEINCEVTKTC